MKFILNVIGKCAATLLLFGTEIVAWSTVLYFAMNGSPYAATALGLWVAASMYVEYKVAQYMHGHVAKLVAALRTAKNKEAQ